MVRRIDTLLISLIPLKKSKLFVLSITVLISLIAPKQLSAQFDSSTHFDTKSFLGRNFNVGVSAGLGGARPLGVLPQPTIKVGNLEVGISPPYLNQTGESYIVSAIQFDYEFFKFRGVKFKGVSEKPLSLVASIGSTINEKIEAQIVDNKFNFSMLLGVNQKLGPRSQLCFRLGALLQEHGVYQEQYPRTYISYAENIYPYGELSYRLYSLPLGQKQYVLKRAHHAWKNRNKAETKKWVANNINPRIALGAGVTHPGLFGPNLGMKLGIIDLSAGLIHFDGELAVSAGGDFDVLKLSHEKKKWMTIGASVTGSYSFVTSFHLGYKKYYKRGAFWIRAGAGIYDHYDDSIDLDQPPASNSVIPTLDISYNIYLFRFRE